MASMLQQPVGPQELQAAYQAAEDSRLEVFRTQNAWLHQHTGAPQEANADVAQAMETLQQHLTAFFTAVRSVLRRDRLSKKARALIKSWNGSASVALQQRLAAVPPDADAESYPPSAAPHLPHLLQLRNDLERIFTIATELSPKS